MLFRSEIDDITTKSLEIETTCLFCDKIFTLKGNLLKHINKTCKGVKELINKKKEIKIKRNELIKNTEIKNNIDKNDYLQEEIEKLKKNYNKLHKKINNSTNIIKE